MALLRLLQEREVVRIGSRQPRAIDVRVIAATNLDLGCAVVDGRFRADLLFRLDVASIAVPALRERPADILPLARQFLAEARIEYGRPDLHFSPAAVAALQRARRPGNVRELENAVRRAGLVARLDLVEPADLHLCTPDGQPTEATPSADHAVGHAVCTMVEQCLAAGQPNLVNRVIELTVRAAFDMAGRNQVHAARLLGVSRNVVRTHLAHQGLARSHRAS